MVERANSPRAVDLAPDFDALVADPFEAGGNGHGSEGTDHFASIYETRDQKFETVVPFVRKALDRDGRCLYVAHETPRETVLDELSAGGIDIDAALETGQLSVRTTEEFYASTEGFDPDRTIASIEAVYERTFDEGYEGLWVAGEMSWVLASRTRATADADPDLLMNYESAVNRFCDDRAATALCQYDRTRFPAEVLSDVIRTHPHVVVDGAAGENFYYSPPEEFPEGEEETTASVDRKLATLAERARREGALERRQRGLSTLTEATRRLMGADTAEIDDCAVEIVRDVLGAPAVELRRYDSASGSLALERTAGEGIDGGGPYEDRVWEAFVAQDVSILDRSDDGGPGDPVAVVPVGTHGVLCVGTERGTTLDDATLDLVTTIAANVEAAYDRAERELTLERTNDRLSRLERINDVVREIGTRIVRADSREEIERTVCDRLAAAGPYRFAWIGEADAISGAVTPRASAGPGSGYLDDIDVRVDGEDRGDPSARALRTGHPQVVEDVVVDPAFASRRERALDYGFRSCVSVPLTHGESTYGVLTVYAGDPEVGDRDREVIRELGEMVAHAVDAVEARTAPTTGDSVELALRVDADTVTTRFAREIDSEVEVDGIVPDEPRDRAFVVVDGDASERAPTAADRTAGVDGLRQVAAGDSVVRLEATVTEQTVASAVADAGGLIDSLTATEDGVGTTVVLPSGADVRAFVERVRESYPDAALVARRSRAGEGKSDPRTLVDCDLTDRQRTVLHTAYRSGFFQSPRLNTGREVADSLDISQPTFTQHLRTAQRKALAVLFDGDT